MLRVKAAGLPIRDPNLKLLRPGDVFRPLVRYNNRDNKFIKATQAQWSLCVVEKIAPEEVRCRVYTGHARRKCRRKAKGGPSRSRCACNLPAAPPRSCCNRESNRRNRWPAATCMLIRPTRKTPWRWSAKPTARAACSSRRFRARSMRVLLIKDGTALLGKLPIVPGLERQIIAPIPNDDQRLGAEGFITGLQEELFDLVAREKILAAMAHIRIESKQFDKAAELIDELRRLPTAQQFDMRLVAEQERLATNDASMQKKIDMLMGDTRQLIDKWLDPQVIDDLEHDLRDARAAGDK